MQMILLNRKVENYHRANITNPDIDFFMVSFELIYFYKLFFSHENLYRLNKTLVVFTTTRNTKSLRNKFA